MNLESQSTSKHNAKGDAKMEYFSELYGKCSYQLDRYIEYLLTYQYEMLEKARSPLSFMDMYDELPEPMTFSEYNHMRYVGYYDEDEEEPYDCANCDCDPETCDCHCEKFEYSSDNLYWPEKDIFFSR